ncbi:MAG: GAP family protein [Cyanobacteria bacterium J06638_7]
MNHLLAELAAFGLAVGFSPLHIALLLLLLLGPLPLRRGGWFVAGWLLTTALVVVLLLSVGHGLLLTMEKGSGHRTGLDLLAAGALLALGLRELVEGPKGGGRAAGWTQRLEGFCTLPLPLLLGLSAALELASPDNVFLLAKAAGGLLEAGLTIPQEALGAGLFCLTSSLLLLLPLFTLGLLGPQKVLPLLEGGKSWLFSRGDLVVGLVSLALAGYLGWQGIEGLRLGLNA